MIALEYVEIDIDFCSLVHGVPPCLAVVTDEPCQNTVATCQSSATYTNSPVTLRFAKATESLPRDIDYIPSIASWNFSPGTVSLGKDLGERSSLTVTFMDHPHSDTGPGMDPYYASRDYNPFLQGTFWGKFRARQPYMHGKPIRLILGQVGQSLAEMETHHFIIESFTGPDAGGKYTITAKDVLKLADGDRAKAPVLSQGFLLAGITAGATTGTLSPAGIGVAEYPSSGKLAIGGKEIVSFTRSADTLTFVARGLNGTTAIAHDAQDRVQLCLSFASVDPATIIETLLEDYADVDSSFIPIDDWLLETTTFLRRVYSAIIAEPTDVKVLVSELIQQSGLAVWWSDIDQEIRLKVLRTVVPAILFDRGNIVKDSFNSQEQPDLRISQVWTYYGQINPLRPVDETDNYRSAALSVDAPSQTNNGTPMIETIYSRWIPQFGRSIALRCNDIILSAYKVPPRKFQFSVFRGTEDVELGTGYSISNYSMQDEFGVQDTAPILVIRLSPTSEKISCEAQEALFVSTDPDDLDNRQILIESDANNINLRDIHDSLYPALVGTETITITVIVSSGVVIGSTSTSSPSMDTGTWPSGITLNMTNSGLIKGAGGAGGLGSSAAGTAGGTGGTALVVRRAITIIGALGSIWSGGGGGGGGGGWNSIPFGGSFSAGGGGGGGGEGTNPGSGGAGGSATSPGSSGAAGTTTANGGGGGGGNAAGGQYVGGAGGSGGTYGVAGNAGGIGYIASPFSSNAGGAGGAAGYSIDGYSYVTVSGSLGSVLGSTHG